MNLFAFVLWLSFILYLLVIFHIGNVSDEYLKTLRLATRIYISLFLLYRFNNFSKKKNQFTEYDRQVVFQSALFLLLTISIAEVYSRFLKPVEDFVENPGSFE